MLVQLFELIAARLWTFLEVEVMCFFWFRMSWLIRTNYRQQHTHSLQYDNIPSYGFTPQVHPQQANLLMPVRNSDLIGHLKKHLRTPEYPIFVDPPCWLSSSTSTHHRLGDSNHEELVDLNVFEGSHRRLPMDYRSPCTSQLPGFVVAQSIVRRP